VPASAAGIGSKVRRASMWQTSVHVEINKQALFISLTRMIIVIMDPPIRIV